jgi:hypothetical protein
MTLITRLSTEDCKATLASTIDTGLWNRVWGSREIVGKTDNTTFQLRMRNSWLRSFTPIFHGRFTLSKDATLIQGEFGIHPLVKVFMIFWFLMLGSFTIFSLFSSKVIMLLYPLGMMAFGAAMIVISLWLGRYQKTKIIAFIKDKLEASDTEFHRGTAPPLLYQDSRATRYMPNQPLAFGTKRVLIIFAWTAGVYYGSNAIITGILVGITFGICHHGHRDVHSYLTAHLSLVSLIGVVLSIFCVFLAAVTLILALRGLLPGTTKANPALGEKSQLSRTGKIVWIAAVSVVIAGFVAWAIYGGYATFIQGTTSGPDFISALQSNLVTTNTISSIEVVEPTRGYMPFTAKEMDSLLRRTKINSLVTINRLFTLLKGAQSGMWPRNMNHPSSPYKAWLKVNTKDGFFWLYCDMEEDYEGSVFSIRSNTRNGTNPNGATSYYLDNFSEALEILNNGPPWIFGPARMPSQSDSTYFHVNRFTYNFYDSKSNNFATVTLVITLPIMEEQFNGWWHGNLAKSYRRPQTNIVLVSDKLNVNFAEFNCRRDPKNPSVATINLNAFDPNDSITLSMPVSNQPVTGHWVYASDGGTIDSGTFTGPIQNIPITP